MARRGIIFGLGSGILRRIVVSDDPNYDYALHVGPDEELFIDDGLRAVPTDIVLAPDCAIIDETGLVVSLIKADPTGTEVQPPAQLIEAYPGVFVGCTYDAGTGLFSAPIVDHPGGTGPGGPYPPFQTGGPIERPTS